MENKKTTGRDIHVFICVVSLVAATITTNIVLSFGFEMDIFVVGRENYESLVKADLTSLVFATLFIRFRQLFIIYLLYRLVRAESVYNMALSFFSFVVGAMICIQTFYSGISGVVEFLLYLFPHFIFYFLIIRVIYVYIKAYGKLSTRCFIMAMLYFAIGLLCELFFSKIFLGQFYQYIV
jgi:hypothetical protein